MTIDVRRAFRMFVDIREGNLIHVAADARTGS